MVTAAVNEKVCPEVDNDRQAQKDVKSSLRTDPVADTNLDFSQPNPSVRSVPFKDDIFGRIDPLGAILSRFRSLHI